LTHHGQTVSDPAIKAKILNNQFASAFTSETASKLPAPPSYIVTQPMPPLELTEESVMKQLALLDVNKSAGPDGLHPHLLHECRTEIVYPLSKLIRLSLDSSKLPAEWKVAYITPIHKKGRKDSVENYRPISITSVVVMLLERIVNKAVIDHLDRNHLLNSYQHGFQCNRSVDTNLLESYDYITKLLELGTLLT